MGLNRNLEIFVKKYLPAPAARLVKRMAIYPRYIAQANVCRKGFQTYGEQYPQKILFIAGLPKSGTTWLEKMIASYPGFHNLLIPKAIFYELITGGSHNYELPSRMFSHFNKMLVVTKMHSYGSTHNAGVLRKANVKYVVLYRDLRDVAISYVFYVRQTPWHPEYPIYSNLSVEEGIIEFGKRLLPAYIEWVRLWHNNRDQEMSLEIQYEQMLVEPEVILTRVARHFGLDSSPQIIKSIVASHSFQKLSGGRGNGQENTNSFFRRGVSGDWKNYFTTEIKDIFKREAGDFFVEFGYEQENLW